MVYFTYSRVGRKATIVVPRARRPQQQGHRCTFGKGRYPALLYRIYQQRYYQAGKHNEAVKKNLIVGIAAHQGKGDAEEDAARPPALPEQQKQARQHARQVGQAHHFSIVAGGNNYDVVGREG